jgi:hypothetical protein
MSVPPIISAGRAEQPRPASSPESSSPETAIEQGNNPVSELSQSQYQKTSLNVSILESTQITLSTVDEPLSLVLKTTIDSLNELLAPEMGGNAIQKAADSGLDASPEATAERIVSLSTSFFDAFKSQHVSEDDRSVLKKFVDTISAAIDKGFNEARGILQGLQVLEGAIATDIDQTYTLVQEKLAAFETFVLSHG